LRPLPLSERKAKLLPQAPGLRHKPGDLPSLRSPPWCPESAPMPNILGLHALPPAATVVGSMG
jgi:hypothetical protein